MKCFLLSVVLQITGIREIHSRSGHWWFTSTDTLSQGTSLMTHFENVGAV